jgi:hypothetical protein
MLRAGRVILDWIGRILTFQTIVVFAQTWLWPVVGGVITTIAGILQGVPIMWALMAGAVTFAMVTVGMLAIMGMRTQLSPQNKLMHKVVFQHDLTPCEAPLIGTRQQRRAQSKQGEIQMLSKSQIVPNVNRTLDKAQLGVEVTNTSFHPISVILERAETEIEGERPPRSSFPKPPSVIDPGHSVRVMDDPIEMEQIQCQPIGGKIDMLIKYGHKGATKFELQIRGTVRIQMESNGFVGAILLDTSSGSVV